MNPANIRIILAKELRDVLSERVYWLAFALELVIVLGVILLGIAFATMMNPTEMASAVPRLELRVGVIGGGVEYSENEFLSSLMGEDIKLVLVEDMDVLQARIAAGNLMGGIVLPEDYDEGGVERLVVVLVLDESKVYSSLVRSRVESAVESANWEISTRRLATIGLSSSDSLTVTKSSTGQSVIPITSPDFVEAMYLMVIPLVMVFPILLSANMTSDSIVGEKENGTLGILMATPASRLDIVLGKVLPVLVLANLQFIAWLFLLENNILGSVRVFNKIPLLILLNMGAICFIGISLLISIRARSTKESNLYLTLVIMLLVFPLFVGIPEMGLPTWVVDSALLVRTIGHVTASPHLPPAAFWGQIGVLGLLGTGIMILCARSVRNLEPPPSR